MKLFNVVQIETRNTCTRKCWFCKFGQERQDETILTMSDETIVKIANELQQLDYSGGIFLFDINEPLQDARLCEIIEIFNSKCPRAFLSIATNGDLLTETIYQKLINAGLDRIVIDIYDDRAMRRLGKYKAFDKVILKDRRISERFINNRGGNIKVNQDKFEPESFADRSCKRPFNMLNIRPNGNVALCCSDLYGDIVMGNVIENSLEEVWNSEKFVMYRHELKNNGRANLELCKTCSHPGGTSTPDQYKFEALLKPLTLFIDRYLSVG